MRIGILSDTHDNHRGVRRAIEIFTERGVECVLHAAT
jgi:predicted phosphodiesterase